jgi:predicted dehydrogenase
VAIHDLVAARRHHASNVAKNVRIYDDLDLMLDGEALDFVDIASPPVFHAAAIRKALEAGAHVLVEKPLCLTAAEFEELAALAAKRSRVLMCVHNWKHAPAYRRARELIEAGRIGELRYLSLVRMRIGAAGAGGSSVGGERWRLAAKTGGGILIDHGWHVFYLAQWLMGGAAPAAISAHLGFQASETSADAVANRPPAESPGAHAIAQPVDDLADLLVAFPDGRIANLHLSWRSPVRRTSALLYGDHGMLEIDGDRITLSPRIGAAEDHSVTDIPDDSYHSAWFAGMAAEFEQAIAEGPGGPTVIVNQAEVRAALALTEAARRSATTAVACRLNSPSPGRNDKES